jgi:hypothetical protein
MRRLVMALAVVAGVALTGSSAAAGEELGFRNDGECTERSVRFSDRNAFMRKEVINGGGLRSLKASVSNGPISVEGGSSAGYEITVCKAAEIESDLDAIQVRLSGNELVADGPDNGRWTVLYHIRTPPGADLELSAKNGPLSLRNVDGTIVVRSKNGPLSLTNVQGSVDAETKNGPITLSGGSGTMKLQAANGPLSIKLAGGSWSGDLSASTKNGPLSVRVPRGYGSSVVVESRGRAPISCRAEGCERSWRGDDDDDEKRIELGTGPANVHLSTVNGPVTINER